MLTIDDHGLGFTVILDGRLIQCALESGGCKDKVAFLRELRAELAAMAAECAVESQKAGGTQ